MKNKHLYVTYRPMTVLQICMSRHNASCQLQTSLLTTGLSTVISGSTCKIHCAHGFLCLHQWCNHSGQKLQSQLHFSPSFSLPELKKSTNQSCHVFLQTISAARPLLSTAPSALPAQCLPPLPCKTLIAT